MKKAIQFLLLAAVLLGVNVNLFLYGHIYYLTHYSIEAKHEEIKALYHKIAIATRQINMLPPFKIVDDKEVNAYATSDEIILNQGLIDSSENDDEIALVLAHEVAHVILKHTEIDVTDETITDDFIKKQEADADKYGAFLMMRAGYNLCTARELYKRWSKEDGDMLIQNHPDFSYRYDQLDVNCK